MLLDYIRGDLDSLSQSIIDAELSFDIWWEVLISDSKLDYIVELSKYPTFFQPTLDAHFERLVIALYRAYENNNKTINIRKLLKELYSENKVSKNIQDEIDQLQIRIEELWTKITILRSNVYAHRNDKLPLEDSFNKAELKPEDLKVLITLCQKLIKVLYLEIYNLDFIFNLEAKATTRMLFQDLKQLR